MGRAKLKMELIAKPKSRILTFKKRKEGMMKKLYELTTLCDVAACMIIYDPTQNKTSIWPDNNPDQVRRLLDVYRSKSNDTGSVKSSGLSDFLKERKRKAEEEVQKLRKNNSEAKYPTWNPHFNSMNEAQLRGVAASLLAKSQIIRSRIQMMRMREQQELEMMKNMMLLNSAPPNNLSQFYNLDQEFMRPAQFDMSMAAVPQNYYAAAQPLPLPPQGQGYPYMVWPNMNSGYDQNVNCWGDDADELTRYLMQLNT